MRAFTYFLGVSVCILGIACAVFDLHIIFSIIEIGLAALSVGIVLKYSKCSNCNEYAVNINPLSKKFCICKKCGYKNQ